MSQTEETTRVRVFWFELLPGSSMIDSLEDGDEFRIVGRGGNEIFDLLPIKALNELNAMSFEEGLSRLEMMRRQIPRFRRNPVVPVLPRDSRFLRVTSVTRSGAYMEVIS